MIPLVVSIIAKTETFQRDVAKARGEIDKFGGAAAKTQTAVFGLSKVMSSAGRGFTFFYLTNSVMNTATAMLKAQRTGESMFDAFLSGIPIINKMAKAAEELADELSGVAEQRELMLKFDKSFAGSEKLRQDLNRSIQLQAAGPGGEASLKSKFTYEDRLKEIAGFEEETLAIKKFNEEIYEQIRLLNQVPEAAERFQEFVFGGLPGSKKYTSNPAEVARKKVIEDQIRELKSKLMPVPNYDILRSQAEKEYRGQPSEFIGPPKPGKAELAAESTRINKMVLDDTREYLASIRSMDDLTRMEKIQNLEEYQLTHADVMIDIVGKETEAGILIRNEIENLKNARIDAMKVYSAELREDMENLALYTSDKFAETARTIESSMSGAFQSMITGGANFRDAMRQFFIDIGASFAKMAADMAAKAAMNAILNSVVGGIVGGIGGGFTQGTPGAQAAYAQQPYPVHHSGWVPYGTPSFQRGRGLKSNEMAAIIEKDELLVPNKQIVKSSGTNNQNFQPQIKVVIVRNEKEAYLEAMNSAEGEKVVVKHAMRNRRQIG